MSWFYFGVNPRNGPLFISVNFHDFSCASYFTVVKYLYFTVNVMFVLETVNTFQDGL